MSSRIATRERSSKIRTVGTLSLITFIAGVLIYSFLESVEGSLNEIQATSAGFMALIAICLVAIGLGITGSVFIWRGR